MSVSDSPTFATGKICYIEIPALDIDRSAAFYADVFGWEIRRGDDGSLTFDDTVTEVSGTWTRDRRPSTDPGLLIYIMVADAEAAIERVLAAGGEVVSPVDPAGQERFAHLRDPAGNVLGVYQQPGLAERESRVSPIPEHLRAVTPRIVVRGGAAAIDFYRRAFGAEEVGDRFTGPDGALIHAEIRIGDSIVAITDEAGDGGPARAPESVGGVVTTIISTYWGDVTAAWERALEAGAEVLYPFAEQFYGERGGRLRDPFGQQWMLSQRIEDLTHEEIVQRAQKMYSGAAES